jgi:hypothetical protein
MRMARIRASISVGESRGLRRLGGFSWVIRVPVGVGA